MKPCSTHRLKDVVKQMDISGEDPNMKMEKIVLELPITDGPLDGGMLKADADFSLEKPWKYTHHDHHCTPHPTPTPIMVRPHEVALEGVIVHDLAIHNPGGNNDETWFYSVVYHGLDPDSHVTLLWNRYLTE